MAVKKKSRRSNPPIADTSGEQAGPEVTDGPKTTPDGHDFLIVGIGASAGGLEAFSQLLRALPEQPGLALIFVQHLAPQHESALATLLTSSTKLPVVQPAEDIAVEVDHVYVVPPNRTLELQDGRLCVQPRPTDHSQYTPINAFFTSLAKSLGGQSAGVILSGTASDGVEGIHAIKAAGGTALVQSPETAKQEGMPRAALATGKIDHVLPPADLAAELTRLARQRPLRTVVLRRPGDEFFMKPEDLERIYEHLRAASGVDFAQYKLPTVQRRIQRRLALHKVPSVEHYLKFLEQNPAEAQQLYQDLLIHVTRFFRDPDAFEYLAREIFPAILKARGGDAPIRIWVPACSTGEEPYSVAIALLEFLEVRSENVPVQIFATDISETAIEQARAGVYPASALEELAPERLQRWFTKTDGRYRINKPIRDLCVFARQDLTRDPPFSRLDLIVCRNVLIYLAQPVQARLMSVFHYALKSVGYLMLGSAESIGPHSDLFAVADKKHCIYRKKLAETSAEMHFATPYTRLPAGRAARSVDEPRDGGAIQAEANRLVLDRYSPPGVIVNDDLRIIQFRGQTGRFLEPAPGDASLNLLKMCREGLLHGLRTALQTAKKKDAPVHRDGLRVKTNGDYIDLSVEVVPLKSVKEGRHYLVLFRDAHPSAAAAPAIKPHRPRSARSAASEAADDIERLQKELVASREYLQSIIQDLEAANEELQSANEEILSSNEELQSTNEELDTAKEELQSTNEELNTLNEELHGRNEELGRVNSDLVNLLNGVQIAIVIVAADLRIRRFTPMAERVLNLIPGDIGRPIGQIRPNVNLPDLERIILEVIDTVRVVQRDVEDAEGRAYSLTVRPYKDLDNRIDGAVLVLFDVDEIRRHEREAQEARQYAEAVFDTVREPLVVLDANWRVQRVNSAFCRLVQAGKSEIEGCLLADLSGGQWTTPRLVELLGEVLATGSHFEDFDVQYHRPDRGRRLIRLNGRRIAGSDQRPALILLAIEEGDGEHQAE